MKNVAACIVWFKDGAGKMMAACMMENATTLRDRGAEKSDLTNFESIDYPLVISLSIRRDKG